MRNTAKLRLYQHIIDHADEMMTIMEENPVFDIDTLPHYKGVRSWFVEVIELAKIRGLRSPDGLVLLDWLADIQNSNISLYRTISFSFYRTTLSSVKRYPKFAKQLSSDIQESDYVYYLESYNPNQTKRMKDVISNIIDETNEGITYVYTDTFRRTVWCFPESQGKVWQGHWRYNDEYGKNRHNVWKSRISQLVEIIGTEYKKY